jgi:Zn-dependent membrane protease YugP
LLGELARQGRTRPDAKLRRVPFSRGLTGAEWARELFLAAGLDEVRVVESRHLVTDHYLPGARVLRLAPQNFHGTNLAAAGIVLHEAGHALQDADGYRPLRWRQTAIRLTYVGSVLAVLATLPLVVIHRPAGLLVLGLCWAFIRANNLLTLAVEFDASARAKELVREKRLLSLGREYNHLEDMVRAAELDKVSGGLKTVHFFLARLRFWKPRG